MTIKFKVGDRIIHKEYGWAYTIISILRYHDPSNDDYLVLERGSEKYTDIEFCIDVESTDEMFELDLDYYNKLRFDEDLEDLLK